MKKPKEDSNPLHRELIEATVTFANTPSAYAPAEWARIFGVSEAEAEPADEDDSNPLLPRELWSVPSGVDAELKQLRHLLDLIANDAKLNPRREQALSRLINERVRARPHFSQGRIGYTFEIDSLEAGVALGIALLFETGMADRLRRCEYCSNFFVIWHGRKHRQQYCSADCAADVQSEKAVERVRRHRERMRQARGK